MKIDDTNNLAASRTLSSRIDNSASNKTTVSDNATDTDNIIISPQARIISSLINQVTALADTRTEKIAALTKAIAEGNYTPTSSEIADAILR